MSELISVDEVADDYTRVLRRLDARERSEELAGWQALARDYTLCGCSTCMFAYLRAASNYPPPQELCPAASGVGVFAVPRAGVQS